MSPSANVGLRSRSGCMTCRRRHRKCDEKRPICRPCQSRGLECDYQTPLRWTAINSTNAYNATLQRKNKPVRRQTEASTRQCLAASSSSTQSAYSNPMVSPELPSPRASPTIELPSEEHPPDDDPPQLLSDDASTVPPQPLAEDGRFDAEFAATSLIMLQGWEYPANDDLFTQWRTFPQLDQNQPFNEEFSGEETQTTSQVEPNQEIVRFEHFNQLSYETSEDSNSFQQASSPAGPRPWITDAAVSGLGFQIFRDAEEQKAFLYYLNRVCACIPAYDSERNPYRRLALAALSYPVLLHSILSVSTGHMHNYGRTSDSLVSSRQSRALKSLRAALDTLQDTTSPRECAMNNASEASDEDRIFSVLSSQEIALATIMMQTSSVLMTGIGNVEIHMKCALHFIQDLGLLHRPSRSIFTRLSIHRFALVDVVLAHLRFRHPLAPPDFFMYQANEQLDQEEPRFREIFGCPQRVLCFLAQISVLSANLTTPGQSQAQILAKAYSLETEMRVYGQNRYGGMLPDEALDSESPSSTRTRHSSSMNEQQISLSILGECFYWTAHLLLLRRVFLDPTRSPRVQLIRRRMFQLMTDIVPGCGPDSSLPFPFYMAAREAVTPEQRDWVRQKHSAMMAVYRDRSRQYMMASTEKIWERTGGKEVVVPEDTPLWKMPDEQFIRDMDRKASYFMF